jgi:formamidopyrimidine-DNA glycosylase
MIEMPEAISIAKQMNSELSGKVLKGFSRGVLRHKFLWLNKTDEEFMEVTPNLKVLGASSYGRSIYLYLQNYLLWWSDTGGKLLFHPPGILPPKKCHLIWTFKDGSSLTFNMQMWGSVKLLDNSEFNDIPHGETGIPPLSTAFTFERFNQMLENYPEKTSKGIKGFLIATGYAIPDPINGLGNAIIQDILFNAKLSPKRKIPDITLNERDNLYTAIQETVMEVINKGGRYDEVDLYGQPGKYIRLMDKKSVGQPCMNCGNTISKISYLGGACYVCSNCQV